MTLTRRQLLSGGGALIAGSSTWIGSATRLLGETLAPLEVASAGSMVPMLTGPVREAISRSLGLELHSHAQGSDAVAKAIAQQTLQADVFIPITAGPMLTVMGAGKAVTAKAFAQTEMVLVYSPKSRFLAQFEAVGEGRANWWEVLQEPGLKIARSNPAGDPGGRNIVFTMMLAATKYHQSDLVQRILGPLLNPEQISTGGNNQARLHSGEIDAMVSYKVGPGFEDLPYMVLPTDVNLSGLHVHAEHPEVKLTLGDKTFYPEPLVFYAASLMGASNPKGASAFVNWLCGPEGQVLLQKHQFDSALGVADLHV